MAFTMYSYFNSTTGDLVISGQEESLGDGYTQLSTPSTNPTTTSGWPWNSSRSSIKTVHIGTIPPIDVTSMSCMFDGCENLTSLDLSSFDTSHVTGMGWMFNSCSSLTSLDLSSFDTSHVTDMSWMFAGCSSLTSIDLSSFNTSQVTDMGYMFAGCSLITSLDLSSFDTSHVTNVNHMFDYCPSLHIIDIPTTATNIVSHLPLENYYDAATGTLYFKTHIPGGSTYVDDLKYIRTAPNIIQTRRGISNAKNTISSRISSIRNGYNVADSRRPARMYIVNDESDSESVTGKKVMRPCVLMVVGSGDVTPVYAS